MGFEANGAISGLPNKGDFDGDAIIWQPVSAKGVEEVWAKVGCCRLGWLRRFLLSLAAFGILMAISAAAFAPGLVKQCGPVETVRRETVPLKSFLLLDASASICAGNLLCPGWEAEKLAAVSIVDAFTAAHGEDKVYAGAAQFSSSTRVEASLSGDLASVKAAVRAMVM